MDCITLPEMLDYSVETIKAAWVLLRKEYPIIACTITSERTAMQYQVPTEGEIIKWIEETAHVDVSGKREESLRHQQRFQSPQSYISF